MQGWPAHTDHGDEGQRPASAAQHLGTTSRPVHGELAIPTQLSLQHCHMQWLYSSFLLSVACIPSYPTLSLSIYLRVLRNYRQHHTYTYR